jgi:hypothetical protein
MTSIMDATLQEGNQLEDWSQALDQAPGPPDIVFPLWQEQLLPTSLIQSRLQCPLHSKPKFPGHNPNQIHPVGKWEVATDLIQLMWANSVCMHACTRTHTHTHTHTHARTHTHTPSPPSILGLKDKDTVLTCNDALLISPLPVPRRKTQSKSHCTLQILASPYTLNSVSASPSQGWREQKSYSGEWPGLSVTRPCPKGLDTGRCSHCSPGGFWRTPCANLGTELSAHPLAQENTKWKVLSLAGNAGHSHKPAETSTFLWMASETKRVLVLTNGARGGETLHINCLPTGTSTLHRHTHERMPAQHQTQAHPVVLGTAPEQWCTPSTSPSTSPLKALPP